jgi:hypothetical protein
MQVSKVGYPKTGYFLLLLAVIFGLSALFSNGHRTGAVCEDGWRSGATGRGACSHHDGVDHWNYADKPMGDRVTGFGISFGLGLTGALLVRHARSKNQDEPSDIERDKEKYLPEPKEDLP